MAGKWSKKKPGPHQYKHAEKDRYGFVVGTKVSKAIATYEKAAPIALVKKKFNSPYMNALKKVALAGHLVEKFTQVIKVTHKDDLPKKMRKK